MKMEDAEMPQENICLLQVGDNGKCVLQYLNNMHNLDQRLSLYNFREKVLEQLLSPNRKWCFKIGLKQPSKQLLITF